MRLTPNQAEAMQRKLINLFIKVSGYLLVITAAAKLISSYGSAGVLKHADPIFQVSFRFVFQATAIVELVVASICLWGKIARFQSGVIAIISSNFLLYRFGLYWMGFHNLCPCLGNLDDMLPISPQAIDIAMKIILAFLLIGSYSALFWLWRDHERPASTKPD